MFEGLGARRNIAQFTALIKHMPVALRALRQNARPNINLELHCGWLELKGDSKSKIDRSTAILLIVKGAIK